MKRKRELLIKTTIIAFWLIILIPFVIMTFHYIKYFYPVIDFLIENELVPLN